MTDSCQLGLHIHCSVAAGRHRPQWPRRERSKCQELNMKSGDRTYFYELSHLAEIEISALSNNSP